MGSKLSSDGFDHNQNHFERLTTIAPIRTIMAPSSQGNPTPQVWRVVVEAPGVGANSENVRKSPDESESGQ